MVKLLSVYVKGSLVQCLSLEEKYNYGDAFKSLGWRHTATIDPVAWISSLLMSDSVTALEVLKELKEGIQISEMI